MTNSQKKLIICMRNDNVTLLWGERWDGMNGTEKDFATEAFINTLPNGLIYRYMRRTFDIVTNGEYSKFHEESGYDPVMHDPIVANLASTTFKIPEWLALEIYEETEVAIARYHFKRKNPTV
ncbi:hypothetical protein [Psychrobacillus vulpis]|uniref:Uncharacterized protein n=1 Tax=Psychrobacillus vulpis TaxID=2325572 RepID=A0A544TV01_9BACI|nr:hypothetical protein [Psychrobacillus vulpis]TQR21261.1 hypothetical protein FG384_03375 [Psychrobacillus vulpis]